MSARTTAHIALFSVNLIYGANYIIAKGLMPDLLGPSGFILLRVGGALLLFWSFFLFRFEKIDKVDILRFAFCGLTGVATNQLFFFNGLSITSPINASIIMTTNPILVLVMSALIIGEKVTSRKVIGVILGAVGAVTLILLSRSELHSGSSVLGDSFVLVNAASYALYLVAVKPLMQKYRPLTVISWAFLMGFIFVIPFGWSQAAAVDWSLFETGDFLSFFYVILFTTFFAYLLNVFALKTVVPTVASSYIYFQPMMAGVFAWIFTLFAEESYASQITWPKVLCAVIIFYGVYLVSKRKKEIHYRS
jgi:drug/metabolite transporter (DMT)-like permease